MDFDGVGGHGVEGAHVGGQLFDVNLDGLGSSARMLFGVSGDDGNGITELEDLVGAENRTLETIGLVVLRQHASPNWKILSEQRTGRSKPSVLLCFGSMTRPLIWLVPPMARMSL